MAMWRIAFLIEGNDLEEVFTAVESYAYNMEAPQRVDNPIASKSKKERKVAVLSTGSQPERVLGSLFKMGKKVGDVITSHDIRECMKEHHFPSDSYSSIAGRMMASGVITRADDHSRGVYMLSKGE